MRAKNYFKPELETEKSVLESSMHKETVKHPCARCVFTQNHHENDLQRLPKNYTMKKIFE